MVPFISREGYSGAGIGGLVSENWQDFEGREQVSELSGAFFSQGFLTRGLGQRIDNRGIDLHSDCTMPDISGDTIKTFTQRAWLEIRRYVIIKDGHLECYFA